MSGRELRYQHVGRFALESGDVLPDVVQAYRLWGELNAARDNLVVLFHSLTGDTDAVQGWWKGVIGPGLAVDTNRYAVLCPNLLGSCYGTTGLPDGAAGGDGPTEERPPVTPRDMVRLIKLLVDELGAREVALATGGSLGGMLAVEWAATYPTLSRAVVVFAAPVAHTAHAVGLNQVQRRAIEIGGVAGLELARMAAMLTYRTPVELEMRFGRERRDDGRFQIQSYLDYQGEKLVARMDPQTYVTLIDAMDAHDVGRGRGGVAAALRGFRGQLVAVGITGDQLYPDEEVRHWAGATGADYRSIRSVHGHDAFLLEPVQVCEILTDVLHAAQRRSAGIAIAGGAA